MASVSAIRDGLRAQLETIDGLRAYDTAPDQVMTPAAVVLPRTISYDATMSRGSDDFMFAVQLVVGQAIDRAGQDLLDGFLAGSGATSVKAAIEAEPTLGGVVDFARVVGMTDKTYGQIEWNGVPYLGAELMVQVTADGAV